MRLVWDFYADVNEKIADQIISEIIQAVEEIKYNEQYQREESLDGNYRRIIVRHFKIIYRPLNKGILILQIFDSRQNPGKLRI